MDSNSADQASLKIIQTDIPRFPMKLDDSLVMNGDATVAIRVDQDGRLTDWLVTGYSHKEFADTAVSELRVWRYEPSHVNGVTWSSVQVVNFDFTRTGVVISLNAFDAAMGKIDELAKDRYAYRCHTLRELDRIPTPIQVVTPASPSLPAGEKNRTVPVDFYIDEEGRVRLPSVARSDVGTAWAACALDAVKQWRFEPPLYRGRPTLAFVRQEFNFVGKRQGP